MLKRFYRIAVALGIVTCLGWMLWDAAHGDWSDAVLFLGALIAGFAMEILS